MTTRNLEIELKRAKTEADQLRRITTALSNPASVESMAYLAAAELRIALAADASCIYLLKENDELEMIAGHGCTPEFMSRCRKLPKAAFASYSEDNNEIIYLHTPEQFIAVFPQLSDLVENSGRMVIALAPLVVNRRLIGILGFSYNRAVSIPVHSSFVLTLVNFCAQAMERARLSAQERNARAEAEAASKAKSDFLANMSHEIRTPIGIVQGYAELLIESKNLTAKEKLWVSVILRNAKQLKDTIGDVLDISKIEAERIELDRCPFSLMELMNDLHATALFSANEKKIALEFEYRNLPCVRSDPTRLRQILLNLISNAVKFTVQGSVRVEARMVKPNLFKVIVIDSGVGIDPGKQKKIFEPFHQTDSSIRRLFGGTGLGLSISKSFAKLLGGDVVLVDSKPGRGSTFSYEMRCEVVGEQDVTEHNLSSAARINPIQLRDVKVLVVEDMPDNQDLVKMLLESEGARVELADCGRDGIEKALAQDFDVILMDIQMPELDGYQAVSILRSRGYRKPIAALTAHAIQSERDRSVQLGFDSYLTKPIDVPLMIQTVRQLVSGFR